MAIRRVNIINAICRDIGVTRHDKESARFAKRELTHMRLWMGEQLHRIATLEKELEALREGERPGDGT